MPHYFLFTDNGILYECSNYKMAIEACRNRMMDDRVHPICQAYRSEKFDTAIAMIEKNVD